MIIIGYIPPVRDEQSVQYGNRFDPTNRGIKPTSAVVKANFQGILSDKEKAGFNRRRKSDHKLSKSSNIKKSKVIRDMTGKGYHIDEIV